MMDTLLSLALGGLALVVMLYVGSFLLHLVLVVVGGACILLGLAGRWVATTVQRRFPPR